MATKDTGKRVAEGETYPRSVTSDVETKIVEVVHVTTCSDGKAYVSTKFDFSRTDEGDILECATKHLVIACRNTEFRTITVDKAIETDGQTLNPVDYIKRERKRGPATPEQLVDKLVKMGVSEAEIAAMIEARTKADAARS